MCGIVGKLTWGHTTPTDRTLIERMNQVQTHRGPDDDGFYFEDPSNGSLPVSVGLAMRRLSIIDLETGKQPLYNETRSVVVVYNGETYNFQELRKELEDKGHKFETHSDTEVLAHGYEEWGEEMPAHLNGMFAFAVWDKKKQKLIIGRDRMGIKPLHYFFDGKSLLFASEIKSILQDPKVPRDTDPFAVDDFLSLRYIPTPKSIYKFIRKVEPGHLLIWEKGEVRFKKYWEFNPVVKHKSMSYFMDKLDWLMEDAIRRQMISDVPLGTFLSGGLDSTTISWYGKKYNPDLMSFTIFFNDRSFSERAEAKEAADFIGTNHIEEEVSPEILPLIPKLVDIFDEPFADDSMVPTYFLTKLAREKMTVALSGDGGDELFAGYTTYVADRLALIYKRIPKAFTDNFLEPAVRRLPVSFQRISLDYKAKEFIRSARRPSPLEHFGWTEIFHDDLKKQLYSKDFYELCRSRSSAESFQKAYDESGNRHGLEKFLYVDQKTHLLDEFLVKVDRLSMANSLEVRPPFLDHRLVEFAGEIPMSMKLKGWTTKHILRELMKKRLPPVIISGAKKGFSPPMARWLATDLSKYAEEKLSPDNLKKIPYLNPEFPQRILREHLQKKYNWSRRLWTLLMFVEWYERKALQTETVA